MSQPFIGPLPYPPLPAQPSFEAWCTSWHAYDVPRLWDSVRLENDRLGWEQATGFRQLSDLLVDHYRRLRTQHSHLSNAWQSPAASELLSRLDTFSTALLSDAHCAQTTATALDGIMTTYADARIRIASLSTHWDNVTSDWVPEWWDDAAEELNQEARDVMTETDRAVADLRTKIIIPKLAEAQAHGETRPAGDTTAERASQLDSSTAPGIHGRVPSVPGYVPATRSAGPGLSSGIDPTNGGLAGLPSPLPAVPGQPVSMLPVPPGSPYAPYGGAYILPGPGVGQGGYIVPMPIPGARGTAGSGLRWGIGQGGTLASGSAVRPSGAASNGMMPVPFGAGGPNTRQRDGSGGYRQPPNTVWEVASGVPPIIEPIGGDVVVPHQPTAEQEGAFKDWFAELAYPWRSAGSDGQHPQIILRKTS